MCGVIIHETQNFPLFPAWFARPPSTQSSKLYRDRFHPRSNQMGVFCYSWPLWKRKPPYRDQIHMVRKDFKHLQTSYHFLCKEEAWRLTWCGNVWRRRWSEPYFPSNHKCCHAHTDAHCTGKDYHVTSPSPWWSSSSTPAGCICENEVEIGWIWQRILHYKCHTYSWRFISVTVFFLCVC